MLHLGTDVAGEPAFELGLNEPHLGTRHTKHGHGHGLTQQPSHEAAPEHRFDVRVKSLLLLEARDLQERIHIIAHLAAAKEGV